MIIHITCYCVGLLFISLFCSQCAHCFNHASAKDHFMYCLLSQNTSEKFILAKSRSYGQIYKSKIKKIQLCFLRGENNWLLGENIIRGRGLRTSRIFAWLPRCKLKDRPVNMDSMCPVKMNGQVLTLTPAEHPEHSGWKNGNSSDISTVSARWDVGFTPVQISHSEAVNEPTGYLCGWIMYLNTHTHTHFW